MELVIENKGRLLVNKRSLIYIVHCPITNSQFLLWAMKLVLVYRPRISDGYLYLVPPEHIKAKCILLGIENRTLLIEHFFSRTMSHDLHSPKPYTLNHTPYTAFYLNCIAFTGCTFLTNNVGNNNEIKQTMAVHRHINPTCHQTIAIGA